MKSGIKSLLILFVMGIFVSCASNSTKVSGKRPSDATNKQEKEYQSSQNRYSQPYWSERFDFR